MSTLTDYLGAVAEYRCARERLYPAALAELRALLPMAVTGIAYEVDDSGAVYLARVSTGYGDFTRDEFFGGSLMADRALERIDDALGWMVEGSDGRETAYVASLDFTDATE